ncbi:MAG: hypothetical protein WD176_09760 [Pirellulales bacterium]
MKSHWIRALALSQILAAAAMAQTFGGPSLMPVPYTGFPSYPSAGYQAWQAPHGYGAYPNTGYTPAQATAAGQPPVPVPPNGNGVYAEGVAGAGAACGDFDGCDNHPRWYISTAALFLKRDRGNDVPLTFDDVDVNNILISSRPCSCEWDWGWEVTLGRQICCGTAIEATYWGVANMEGADLMIASAQASGALNTFLNFGGLLFDDGTAVAPLFDTGVGAHLLTRTSTFHNVEINLVHEVCRDGGCGNGCGGGCGACRSWTCTWLAGIRYFHFHDDLLYATSSDNEDFVFDANEAYYDVDIQNHLVGAQIGARLDWNIMSGSVSLWALPRVGLYANHVSHQSNLVSLGRTAFDISSSKDDVAVIGQLDLGLDWHITDWLTAFGGYRVLGVAGVALPEEQIPPVMTMSTEIASVDTSGHVILHGAFVGMEVRW